VQAETRVDSAWLHRLKLQHDKLLLSFASNFNVRPPYTKDGVKKIGEGTYGEAYKGGGTVGSGVLRVETRVQSSCFVACN